MKVLFVLSPFLAAIALVLISRWLERRTGHTGLSFAIGGVVILLVGIGGLILSPRWIHALFVVQGVGFLAYYRWSRSQRTFHA